MDKPEFTNSLHWQIVEKALREYGQELVQDMRAALAACTEQGKEKAVELNGALRAVDEMLALPNKLWPPTPPLSRDNENSSPPAGDRIKRFH